jgi:hypothetical protein
MANLCAQASTANPAQASTILHEAAAFRDRLLVAARAAELMLDEVALASSVDAGRDPAPVPRSRQEDPGRSKTIRPSPNRPTSHRP